MKILFPGFGLLQFTIGSTVSIRALSEEPALAGVILAMSVFCLMLSWLCFHHLAEIGRLTRFVEMKRVEENVEILKRNPDLTNRPERTLEILGHWRWILQEDMKGKPPEAQRAALARFDQDAEKLFFLERS